jgi:hypothetical protein
MQKCGNCGHENRAGVVFCENCGASLIGKQPLSTKALDVAPANQSGDSTIPSPLSAIVQEMAIFKPGDILKLSVEGTTKPIELQPKGEVILGRRDPATGTTPDVDLTPFAGYRMGVSRRHAAIRQGDDNTLNVWDLGSSNGTFLNGQRLNAHRPYPLRDGDELRLGQMVIRVNFKPAPATVAEPAPAPLPSTRPLQPIPEASAPATSPAVSPKPVTGVVPAAPVPVTAPQPPAEKPAAVVTPPSPTAAEEAKPAVSAPEAPAAPATVAPADEGAASPAPAAEQPAAPAPSPAPAAAEQPAAPVVARPEAAEPAPPTTPPQETQPAAAAESAAPAVPLVHQEQAPPPPAAEQGSEPEAGKDKTTPPDS